MKSEQNNNQNQIKTKQNITHYKELSHGMAIGIYPDTCGIVLTIPAYHVAT